MPAACSVATSVQACFGCTATPVASMNARTAGCGHVRDGAAGDRSSQLHLAGHRRAPRPRRRASSSVAARRHAHVDRQAELVGNDVAGGAAVRQRDRDGVVELEAVDHHRLLRAARRTGRAAAAAS